MTPQDEAAIRNLIGRIAWLTDKWSTTEEYLESCTTDIWWELNGTPPYSGHDGMARRLEEMLEAGVCGPGIPTRHHITSLFITAGNTPDTASVRSFVMMTCMVDGAPILAGYADYYDEVRKVDDRWLLARRYCETFWDGQRGVERDPQDGRSKPE